ncbi:MAG: hypothetical protein J0L75_05350 [Spirochaetes bacterium]|nr:hypothetical protein [Spirochaetota bacterium]
MKDVLLIGCGGIGFRHFQSLLTVAGIERVTLHDPFQKDFSRFEAERAKAGHGMRLEVAPTLQFTNPGKGWDLAIAAATANAQPGIAEALSKVPVRSVLLEKPVAQGPREFEAIVGHYGRGPGIDRVFVNCARNFWPGYEQVRTGILAGRTRPTQVVLNGYNWGYGCNAVHYLELHRHWFGSTGFPKIQATLMKDPRPSKRGDQFEDFFGIAVFEDHAGNILQLSTMPLAATMPHDIVLNLYDRDTGENLGAVEETRQIVRSFQTGKESPWAPLYVSQSTARFIEGLDSPGTGGRLPTLAESAMIHGAFYESLRLGIGDRPWRIT